MIFEKMTQDYLQPYLNTTFNVTQGELEPIPLTLTKVDEKKQKELYRLSLCFVGPEDTQLPQGNGLFEHDELQPVNLFMVPVGKSEKGVLYEVIVNRLTESADPEAS